MQLTNIARDVGEDARRGRIYLPLRWLREEGIDPKDLLGRPSPGPALARVVARLLGEADALYRRADAGIAALPRDCRVSIFAARLIYSDIGRYVARVGFDSVTRRAYVPTLRKLWLLVRSITARWMRGDSLAEPPLEPTRFLVQACTEAPS
jgi:phytoene synthase